MRGTSATYVPGNDEVLLHVSGKDASVIVYLTIEEAVQLAGQLGTMPEQAAKSRMGKSAAPHPSAKGAPHVELAERIHVDGDSCVCYACEFQR